MIKLDFVCPETMKEIDYDTCKSFCFNTGCKKIINCKAIKKYRGKKL